MARITLVEYAERLGKSRATVYMKYRKGGLKTARKEGIDIWIDEDEPYTDDRVKTGRYFGWRNVLGKHAEVACKPSEDGAKATAASTKREGQSQKSKTNVKESQMSIVKDGKTL